MRLSFYVFIASLCLAAGLRANDATPESALRAYTSGQWELAAKLYAELAGKDPGADNFARLGKAQFELGRLKEAESSERQALAKDPDSARAHLFLAMIRDKSGDGDGAFDELGKSVTDGLPLSSLQHDPGLDHLRGDKRFPALFALADKLAHPCQSDARYRAFDFWVGDWDVYVGGIKTSANNLVTLEMHGCLIHEHWHGGGIGESFNYYDPHAGKWRQNYVDEGGGVVWYEGAPVTSGVMHMEGGYAYSDGSTGLARVTWTANPDGSVHHFIERSTDGGKHWATYFDAVYRKAPTQP